MDFEKICMLFTMQEPYYGILLSSMDRIPSYKTQTMGVGRSGNVFKLYYNPDFVSKLDVPTTMCCLKHEVLHVAMNHFGIWDDKEGAVIPEDIHMLRNWAADMEVNGYVDFSGSTGVKPVFAKDFGWKDFLGTREYFNRLMQKNQQLQEQQAQAQEPQEPCNGGEGGLECQEQQDDDSGQEQNQSSGQSQSTLQAGQEQASGQSQQGTEGSQPQQPQQQPLQGISQTLKDMCESFDDHSQWPECDTEEAREALQQVVESMLVFAADEVEKSQGKIPGELVGIIGKLRARRVRPVADWKRYFRRYLGNEFSELIKKSKKRESKRFPDAAGNRHRRKSHILVAIDTSGSVSMPEYHEFFNQIKTLQRDATFHVVECDTIIQHEYDFKGRPAETLHGGGGTSFTPPIDYFIKNRKQFDCLVYFTDGYASIPSNTPKETLWVISSDGNHDRSRYRVNGASVVIIPKK